MALPTTVSAYEAKTHLSALLDRASRGESIVITKRGRPVAKLIPLEERPSAADVISEMRRARTGVRLDGQSLREMIEEGRRY